MVPKIIRPTNQNHKFATVPSNVSPSGTPRLLERESKKSRNGAAAPPRVTSRVSSNRGRRVTNAPNAMARKMANTVQAASAPRLESELSKKTLS
jgi:hypothetical protein